jgi:hypothetical protein
MKTKKCGDFGTLEYRLPNIPETMILLGQMGLNSKKMNDAEAMQDNELLYTAKMIMNLGEFITKIDLEIDGEKITTFDALLNEFEMMVYINELAMEIFDCIGGSSKKKALRKMQ